MKYDVIVIGSGIAGLTCGAIMGLNGRSVLILEANPRIGGALKCFKRQKIVFDVGFHYTASLGENEILRHIWSYCGVLPNLNILPFPEHGHDRLYIDQFSQPVRAFFSYDRFSSELKEHFPDQSQAIDRYFSVIQQICSKIPFYNESIPLTNFLHGFRNKPQSFKKFVLSITDNPRLQAIFFAPSFLYGVPAEQASLETHAMVAHGYYSGAYHVSGGGQAIVNSFKQKLRTLGVDYLTNHTVQKIQTDGRKIEGVITQDEEFLACENVIFTGHPSTLPEIVDTAFFRPAYTKRLLSLENSISMFALFGTTPRNRARDKLDCINHFLLPAGVDVIPPSHEKTLKHQALLLTSTERDQNNINLRQDRKSVILLKPLSWNTVSHYKNSSKNDRPTTYIKLKEQIAESMKETAEQYWGDFFGPLDILTTGTPLTFRDELMAPQGGAYGAMHGINQLNPGVRTRLPGLWLAGQSILMTGIVGSSISGLVSAGEIIGLEPLWEKIRACN